MVTDEVWIYPWGFISIPGKDINVPSEEFYQLLLLLMRQLGSNLKEPLPNLHTSPPRLAYRRIAPWALTATSPFLHEPRTQPRVYVGWQPLSTALPKTNPLISL